MNISLFLAIFLGVLSAGLMLRYWPKAEAWAARRRDRIRDERFIARAAAARRDAFIRERDGDGYEAERTPVSRLAVLGVLAMPFVLGLGGVLLVLVMASA